MITVHRIELVNFRSIPYAVIEPNIDGGMTALAGGNGLGKTSVVHGLDWALYGITPTDVAVKGLRRQGSDGQECRVTVTFEHDGQIIEATRALKGKNDTTVAFVKVDGKEITNVSAKTAVAWMQNRLGGLDAAGFLTAFVVRQKEMDDLVKARPAERKRLIERLAGIERMSDAVQRARETENDAKKTVVLLPGSDEEVAAAREESEASAERITDAETAHEQAAADLAKFRSEAAIADEAAAAARMVMESLNALANTHKTLTGNRALLDQDHGYAQLAVQKKTEEAENGRPEDVQNATDAYAAAKSRYDAVQEALTTLATLTGTFDGLNRTLTTATGELEEATRVEAETEKTYLSARDTALSVVEPSAEEIAEVEAQWEAARTRRADAQAEYRRLSTAIKTLSESTHPACPTCNRDMDDPSALLAGLQTALEVVTREGSAAKADEESTAQVLHTLKSVSADFTAATNALRDAQKAHEDAQTRRAARQRAVDDITAEIEQTQRLLADARSSIGDTDIETLQGEMNVARDAMTAAKKAADALAELPSLNAKVADIARQIADVDAQIADIEAQIASHDMDAEGLAEMERSAREATARVNEQALVEQKAAAAVTLAHAEAKTALGALSDAEAKLAAKASAVKSLQEKTATREALEAFRQDRLARIAPELAEVTTDLVTRMTNGRYVAVDFDQNFTPILTDANGEERPASWLSGGEESVVALALRIGIGEIISGSKGGLLVLDEVLTAQDPDRRQAMMSAIRELPGRQVLMINHVAEALDIADTGYLFTTDEDDQVVVVDLAHAGESTVHLDHALDSD